MFRRRHKFSDQLSTYIDGRLSERERPALEAHLEACPSCQRELQELQATVEALRSLPPQEAPRSFALRPEQVAPRPARRRPAPSLGGLAAPVRLAAASLAVALAVVVLLDVGDFGGDGEMAATQGTPAAPAAERAAEPSQAQGEGQAELQEPEATPTPAEAAGLEGQQPATAPSPQGVPSQVEGGGLDPLRAAEIALAAALGTIAATSLALAFAARKR